MKKISIAALAAIATLSFVSCQGFLETNPTSSVADNQVFTSIQGANAALNGCYNLLHFNDEGYGRGDVVPAMTTTSGVTSGATSSRRTPSGTTTTC